MEGGIKLSIQRTKLWLQYITELKLHKRGIENIPPEKVRLWFVVEETTKTTIR